MALPTLIGPTSYTQGSMQADLPRLLAQSQQRRMATQQPLDGLAGATGPLHDPQWDAWFEATNQASGGKPVTFGGQVQPGQQLAGASAQPDYLTSNPTFQGRLNKDYKPTLFAPGQQSAVTGMSYEDAQNHVSALKGLKNVKGY